MSNTYTAVVFLKNCLVRYEQKCAEFEILPFSGLGLTDEIALLNDYLGKHGFEDLNNADVLSEAGRREQPTAIVRLPNISAVSHIECHDEAVKDAEILSDVLALQRFSYGAVIATIVIDYVTGRYWFWFNKPTYTGNLLGGSISGEHTGTTLERFCKVRKDASLRLYIKLYRDAVGEQDVEMAYYRFWAILEALARTKNLSGCQKLDRQGVPLLNRQGTPCYVNNQAEPLVMELLRRVHFGPKYSMVDPLGHLFDLVPIWYRHRNCIAHGGGCRPDDPIHCHRNKEQFVRCRDMHIKVVEGSGMPRGRHADQLLRTLESEAQLAVMQEFCGSGSI